jgi:type IV pilus assembly protein PilW
LTGDLPSGASLLFLTLGTKEIKGNGTIGTCPSSGMFLVFPYDSSVGNGCENQFCNLIEYYLYSSSSAPFHCADGTFTLGRKVGNGNPTPILYCVADFKVRFKWNGSLVDPSTLSNISYIDEKNNLRQVNVYLLVQEGKRDPEYKFSRNKVSVDGVDLNLSNVTDYQHYRWKVVKISVRPMNL